MKNIDWERMEEFKGRRRRGPFSNMFHNVLKRFSGIGHERFDEWWQRLGRHPERHEQEAGVDPRCRRAAIGILF